MCKGGINFAVNIVFTKLHKDLVVEWEWECSRFNALCEPSIHYKVTMLKSMADHYLFCHFVSIRLKKNWAGIISNNNLFLFFFFLRFFLKKFLDFFFFTSDLTTGFHTQYLWRSMKNFWIMISFCYVCSWVYRQVVHSRLWRSTRTWVWWGRGATVWCWNVNTRRLVNMWPSRSS